MPVFRISGVWKSENGVITHYAIHSVIATGVTRAEKKSKTEAISLLETVGNSAATWIWSYSMCHWIVGEQISVVKGVNGKYLRSNPDNQVTDNLAHLINFDWLIQ